MLTGIGYFGLVISCIYATLAANESRPTQRAYKVRVATWSGVIGTGAFVLLNIWQG